MNDGPVDQRCTSAPVSLPDAVGRDPLSVERRFKLLTELTRQVAYEHDVESGSVSWDGAITQLTGHAAEELQAFDIEKWQEMVHPDDRFPRSRALDSARHELKPYGIRYRLRRKDGVYTHVEDRGLFLRDDSGRVVRAIGSIMDVSERRELEQQLIQAQKMEAIGRLAGGVAHDFNNIINIIIGYTEWELRRNNPDAEQAESLQRIMDAAERAAELTHQLLAFARKENVRPSAANLNVLIREFHSMLRRLIGEDIALTIDLDPELENVFIDPGQIHQILMNLVANSRDAMPDGGMLTIKTANADVKTDDESSEMQRRVLLSVSDTGHGMSPEVVSRVFEPFFTTKSEGTGLGLAAVHDIAQQSGASIRVESTESVGTTVSIFFPPATAEDVAKGRPPASVAADGRETILLVEDDIGLLKIMKEGIELRGYTVLAAENGEQALELSRKHVGAIDLLLTDVVMPSITGRELAQRLMVERPSLRTLYISGYTADFIERKNLRVEKMDLLCKPFNEEVLHARIRAALDVDN